MDLPEVASIAVIHNGKTLWLQRADNHRFTMPGGHLEPNEEPIAGAVRELNEEAGIDPNGGLIYLGQDVSRGRIIHAFALHCDELPEVNIANDPDKEAVGHYWLDELPDNPHVPHEHNVALKLLNPLTKSETKKFWKSKDGAVKIPHHTNPDRKDWDKRYYESLVQHFGYGDPSRLQPVEIPVTPNISGTNAVKDKTRHSLYVRMLRGGDTVPPLVVRRNGISWHVLDGNHRLDAALQAGAKTLKAYEMVDPKPKGKLKKSESPSTLDHGIAHHDQDVWIEEAPYGELLKGKKDALNMYPQEIRNHPDTKVHLDWAYGKMPNENWSLWTVRHHRTSPKDFTPEVKQKIEHFAGSQHIPEIANVRFDKTHNLQQGLELLDAAENRYIERTKSKLNLAPKPAGARKHVDLGNGLAWWNLGQPACAHEGKAMGHCGNVPSQREGQHLFSLRQEHKLGDKVYYEPHLTFIRHPDEVGFGEMKGRGNEKPAKHYHKAIVALFKKGHLPIGGGYAPHNNFHADDLSPEDFEEVRQSNPAFAGFRSDAKPEDLHAAFDLSPQSLALDLSQNKKADAGLLRKIVKHLDSLPADDYSAIPYLNVLQHQNLPPDLMHHLADHHDPDVREVLADDDRTPSEILHKLAKGVNSQMGFKVAGNPNISTETAKILFNRYSANPDIVRYGKAVLLQLALNSNVTDPDLVRSLVTHPNPTVRNRIATRQDLAPEHVHQLSLDEDPTVRRAVAQRPNTSEEITSRLASDPDFQVREALAFRKELPHDIAQQLALDPDWRVQQAALGLKEITTETLGKVIDRFPSSIHLVAPHPNLTEELMHKLLAMGNTPPGLAYRSNLPESIKEALFDRAHSNPMLHYHIAQGLRMAYPEFWARKTREKMAELKSNQLAKGQIAKEHSYGWGASHQGSKDITHISSKMMGIKGFDEFDDNTQNAHNLARHFLSNMHNHRSPEELGHVTLNHRNLAHNIGDVIDLPLTATSTAEDDPSMAYATRGFSVPEEYQSDTTKRNKTKEALYYKFPAGIPYHPYKLNKDDDEPELALEFGQVGEGIVAGRFRVANKIPKVNYVNDHYTEVHLEPVEYFHPEHGWFSAQNKGAMFKKGLKEVALAGALALGGTASAQENVEPKPNPDLLAAVKRAGVPTTDEGPGKWHTQGLHKELIPIAHLESSFGQNMAHAKGKGGDYDTAYGAVGLKPMTAHEEYLRTPTLQKLYGDLKDPAEFTKKFKADWQFYNLVASAHFARLKKLHGTPEKAAYAWRWGTGAAAGATDEQVANEIYVQKYKNLALNTGVKKSEALDKMAIKDLKTAYEYAMKNELQKSATKLVSKIVPHLTDDLRRAPWKGSDNCLAGHCYVASEALWHLMGGPDSGYVPQSIQHEGGPHWYLKHKVTGEIIDPTAGQFKTPVPYEKGIGKGFLTKLPSKRAQVVIDRVAGKLNKMAIRDLKPQRSAVQEGLGVQTPNPTELEGKTPLEHFPGQVFNYSHYLPEEMRNNLRLSVVTEPQTGRISALVHSPDTRFDEGYGKDIHQEYGRVTGGIYPKSKRLEIGYSFLAKPFRGKGIGLAAYEAIYAHAFHNHKVREVIGLDHSTAAHKVHNSLATKHGLEYKAENQMDWKPSKDFDSKYAPYKYTLKAELHKMAIKDIKGKPIEGEHGLVQLDFSHLLHPEIAKTHKLFTRHYGWEGVPTDHVAVRLVHRDTGDRAGKIDAGVEGRAISPIDVEVFDPKLRGRGVGRAMYEALYGHVYHTLGIKKVVGGTHSSMANKAHLSVTSKHKLPGYNPEQIGRVKGPRDDAFGDYEYSLISRP
jgi:8-oxo-dGTP pyrophosphatase MutT (NUDIX family)/GNAT superfamily N-acetyltransferase